MKISGGTYKWVEEIKDDESILVKVKEIKTNKNGANYLTGFVEETGEFFMINIMDGQAEQLRGVDYTIMKCTGHDQETNYPYLQFDVYDEYNVDEVEDISQEDDIERVYTSDMIHDDLEQILTNIHLYPPASHDLEYNLINDVERKVLDALLLIDEHNYVLKGQVKLNYVGNAFSPNMVPDGTAVRFEKLTKSEFLRAAKGCYSCIGHPEIADALGLEYNRTNIDLLPGDVLYIVTPGHRPKNELYTFVPERHGWIYRRCEVLEG